MDRIKIRLQETALAPGEITLADVAAIAGRLQELSTRVSRWVADIDGAGRGPRIVEAAAALRLSGVEEGSTVLMIDRGMHDALDFDMPFERDVTAKYWDVISGLSADRPPSGAPAAVRESAIALLDALERAAPLVTVVRTSGGRVEFRPGNRDRAVWQVQRKQVGIEQITIAGRLEMVDLRNSKFRIADDVGNRIMLEDVENAEAISRDLVGKRATASGVPTHGAKGRLISLTAPTIEPAPVPAQWRSHAEPTAWLLPENVSGPDPDGGVDFDDDEWARFLAAIKGE
ncbi:hypothetical protein OCAE111667_09740 [Occultella aeris]|uniref:Uncharacterized protein n=1 Tax=Occultella aeris TaxID=2761496 RepID=A0A7M4DIB6_9MICO|nr:hypothetical protein [Occultella aeris]VZO36687.1 hypothetical protein HALOF300_01867 [Occultella aeris]